jgi:prephenate dehydrogenase
LKPEDLRVRWKKVALIGVGLLGGSLGLALKQLHLARTVVGFVRRRSSLKECRDAGAVDLATLDLCTAVTSADLIVLCTPIAQMERLVHQMLPALAPGVIITDVGSVKAPVIRNLESITARAGAHFVGSHPMAGGERTGVQAARAELFRDAVCVVTPTARTSIPALRKVARLWATLGSRVLRMSPGLHDQLVSRSSHLPHVVAAVLAHSVLSPAALGRQRQLCATGFRDTTRIASGSPEMWRDIALANRKNLRAALASFRRQLDAFDNCLKQGNERALSVFFEQAKQRRDQWGATHISPSLE